jgi:phospholipase/carboxylesterase/glyoxalase family protein
LQTSDLGFIHQFVPATDSYSDVTLLLLHGTGGNEKDLLPLGSALLPDADLLSPRGKVLENGMPRFFRRFAEGVFDVEDLKARTDELAGFLEAAVTRYKLKNKKLVAVGYSNGANIAASLILLHPHHLAAATLFRPMVPFEPDIVRDFSRLSILIGAGRNDSIVGSDAPQQLAAILDSGGADVSLFWHNGGHELGQDDVDAATVWLKQQRSRWATPKVKGNAQ